MEAAVCYSGGSDSTLAALVLDRFYDVTCVTATFGITEDYEHAAESARAVGFPVETIGLDPEVATAATERIIADGFPRNGIQQVHEHALEVVASGDWEAIADGTRRDDRAPTVDRATAQSIEDRHGVDYAAPLAGVGHGAVEAMTGATLERAVGPSEELPTGDYEAELRAKLRAAHGEAAVADVFPSHEQSRVVGLRERR